MNSYYSHVLLIFLQLSGSTLGAGLVAKNEEWYAGTKEQNRTDDQVHCMSVKRQIRIEGLGA